MRKLFASLLVLAMCVPAMAATITFGPANNSVSGQVSIPWTADAGVVGMALKVDVTGGGTCTAVAVDSFFDVFMDSAYTQELGAGYVYKTGIATALQTGPGEQTLPAASFSISIGGLDDDGIGAGTEEAPTSGTIVLTGTPLKPVAIAEDTLRGGVVGYAGAMTIAGLPIATSFGGVAETISKPTINKTTAAPAVADKVNGGRVETFVAAATSSISDPLEYQFTWGDGVVGPWGAASQTHTYTYGGPGVVSTTGYTYNVTVQARCATHTAIVSAVSDAYVVTSEAVKSTAAFYAAWAQYDRKSCWAFPRNCKGDADGTKQGSSVLGYVWVGTNDLNTMLAGYGVKEPTKGPGIATISWSGIPGICADFRHDQQGSSVLGYNRVGTNDLNDFLPNYNVKEPTKGPGVPICDQGNYHYWTVAP